MTDLPGKDVYLGQFYVPEGYTLVEYGMLYSSEVELLELDTLGVSRRQGFSYVPVTNEYMMSFDSTQVNSVRAYLVVKNSDNLIETIYSNDRDLFISEYAEGSSSNKWLEIYNPTDKPIDLSNYEIRLYSLSNDRSTRTNTHKFNSGTIIESSSVYILYNSSETVVTNGDVTSTVCNFNGDDPIGLFKNGVLIDTFGIIGDNNGSWVENTITENHTLIRIMGITSPSTTWNYNEWKIENVDTTTYLGYHNIVIPTPQSIVIDDLFEVNVGDTIKLTATVLPADASQQFLG